MYGIRHIPVQWLLGFFNIMNAACDFIVGAAERTWSFGSTLVWNLTGLDQYYVFQDQNPTPIPYRSFWLGGLGDRSWYYNTRTRVFELNAKGAARKFIPVLAIEYNHRVHEDHNIQYDLTKWLDSLTFKSVEGVFPHPMQLVAAWSLHSGIWSSFHNDDRNQIKLSMMCGDDGNTYDIPVDLKASEFSWRRFANGQEGSETSSSGSEEETSQEEDEEDEEEDEDEDEENESESEDEDKEEEEEESEDKDKEEEEEKEEAVKAEETDSKSTDTENSQTSASEELQVSPDCSVTSLKEEDEITQVTTISESPVVLKEEEITPAVEPVIDTNYFEQVD